MKKALLILIIILALLFTGLTGLFLINSNEAEPPDQIIEKARVALSIAEKSKSETYAPAEFHQAVLAYDSALLLWKLENRRFIAFRNYSRTNEYASRAYTKAAVSLQKSCSKMSSLKNTIGYNLNVLEKRILNYKNLENLPLQKEVRENLIAAEHTYREACKSYEENNLIASMEKSNKVCILLQQSDEQIRRLLKSYFEMHQQWVSWVKAAIEQSKRDKSNFIVVDKFSRQCYLYKNGYLTHGFSAELGLNWMGDKHYKGDKSTPEGKYLIVSKKKGRNTKYHKALLINYPSEEDQQRFERERKSGLIPAGKHIGSHIEIHGSGGRGFDWTDGCIALTNADIDLLFDQVETGTIVIIVGSLKPLTEYMKLLE